MHSLALKRSLFIICLSFAYWQTAGAQDVTRDLTVAAGSTIEVVNKYGRVGARAVAPIAPDAGSSFQPKLTASSARGVSESEIKMTTAGGHLVITVAPADIKKRIDLALLLPERTKLKVETAAGAVEIGGNFASIEARTDTGTIALDVPTDDLKYHFIWTESRPRYLADFDIAEVKEKSGGRFEIKGRSGEVKSKKAKVKSEDPGGEVKSENPGGEVKSKKLKVKSEDAEPEGEVKSKDKAKSKKLKVKSDDVDPDAKEPVARDVSLELTTARGIILLNVPLNEVMSDLRERPLTEAAKAIVRSGDSLLMEAIRRASPKYFGDYTRSLPPIKFEPAFSAKRAQITVPVGELKTALVRVTDAGNRAIGGLEAKDFEVVESGTEREIVSVTHSTAPFNLVLLLDVSGSVENYVNFIRRAARNFVDTVDTRDRVSIVIFNEDVKVLSRFTTDKQKLSASLDTFDAGGGTAFYDALGYTVADTLRPLKGERTAIVILTDGDDNRSFLAFDSLMGSIQESGALVYPLYVPSGLIALAAQTGNGDIDPLRKKYMSLTAKSEGEGERLAKISGGVYYPITQIGQIQRSYEDIVLQLRSAYNITYRSDTGAVGTDGMGPRLKVRAKRDGVFTTISSVVAVH